MTACCKNCVNFAAIKVGAGVVVDYACAAPILDEMSEDGSPKFPFVYKTTPNSCSCELYKEKK